MTIDGGWVVEDEPSQRFPVYTRGNAGEVYPNVMTPLTGSLIGDAAARGQTRAMQDLGMLLRRDLAESGTVGTGVFGGYLYGNLSLMRVICERAPGLSADDADLQVAGLSAEAPMHRRRRGDRSPTATLRGSWVMGRKIFWPDISAVDEARVETDRWCASHPPPESQSDEELIELVRGYPERFENGMRLLLRTSSFAGAGGSAIEQFAERVGAPAGAAQAMMAGLGTIDSAAPAFRLWTLGRLTASSQALTRIFDDGGSLGDITYLADRTGSHDVVRFISELEMFLESHGARGPDEWELASPTWGTNPEIALAAVDRLRHAPEHRDPLAASVRLAGEREHLTTDVRRRLPRPVRPVFDRAVASARLYSEGRERAKTIFIDDLYPVRCALFELAARTRRRGGPVERSDFFLVTIDELPDFVANPGGFASLIVHRRERRDFLQEREPPFVFEGEMPDPATWPLRSARQDPATTAPLGGQGVCAGIARGVARIVRDPADPRQLEPGDILVAPLTDPAWTPLFLAVAGVIVEVGAQLSHAAIVARELGIPAVVGVAEATTRLVDGQLVEIDGASGTVTIL